MPRILQTVVARAFIVHCGKVLLMRMKGKSWYYTPGGHVNAGEKVLDALKREIKEEFGVRITKATFIGAYDNHFYQTALEQHSEIGIIFSVTTNEIPTKSLEAHEECLWVPLNKITKYDLLPRGLGSGFLKWKKNEKLFWFERNDLRSKQKKFGRSILKTK